MSKSPCKYLYLRHWLTGEGYGHDSEPRPVILECIPSRSGMSMPVYDRGERIFTVQGCGFDRMGTALGDFLEACFQPELSELAKTTRPGEGTAGGWTYAGNGSLGAPLFYGFMWNHDFRVVLEGGAGFQSMAHIAQAIGLKVHRSESKAGTLIIIERSK